MLKKFVFSVIFVDKKFFYIFVFLVPFVVKSFFLIAAFEGIFAEFVADLVEHLINILLFFVLRVGEEPFLPATFRR